MKLMLYLLSGLSAVAIASCQKSSQGSSKFKDSHEGELVLKEITSEECGFWGEAVHPMKEKFKTITDMSCPGSKPAIDKEWNNVLYQPNDTEKQCTDLAIAQGQPRNFQASNVRLVSYPSKCTDGHREIPAPFLAGFPCWEKVSCKIPESPATCSVPDGEEPDTSKPAARPSGSNGSIHQTCKAYMTKPELTSFLENRSEILKEKLDAAENIEAKYYISLGLQNALACHINSLSGQITAPRAEALKSEYKLVFGLDYATPTSCADVKMVSDNEECSVSDSSAKCKTITKIKDLHAKNKLESENISKLDESVQSLQYEAHQKQQMTALRDLLRSYGK